MPTDTYTKAVLTVIAACLVILVLRGTPLVGTAHAADDRVLAVDIVKLNGRALFGNDALPVNLKQVDGRSLSGSAIPVDIEKVSGSSVSSGLPIRNR